MQQASLGPWAKSFPVSSWGMSQPEFLATEPRLSDFGTPLLTIDRSAAAHNVALMADWVASRGLRIAPHGKTTMAPQLWRQVLDAGAWGITLATPWQVQVARSHGIERILLANEVLDPKALGWLGHELADPEFEFACWVDSVEGVENMRRGLVGAARPFDVILDVGQAGGRSGARSRETALAVVAAVEAAPELRLAGVGGYEGSYGNSRSAADVAAVAAYLDRLVDLSEAIAWDERPIVTAGGSAFVDLVADRLAPLAPAATVILRSGAYQLHDDGFYGEVSPLTGLRAAIHGWARVLSRPEPELAILDGGKRDFPYDLGMPVSRFGAVTRVNDQHAYLSVPAGAAAVGEVLRLGLSHPCTALDKWRLIPMVDDAESPDPRVVDLVATWF